MKHVISLAALATVALSLSSCTQQQVREKDPVKVKTTSVKPTAVQGGREYSGVVEASTGSSLSFSVAGTVQRINVSVGQRVAKGDLIADLDEATMRSAYDAAAATLEQAEDAYARMKQLNEAGSLPEIQWVEVQSKLRQAQSSEAISKKSLTDCHLYAPYAGVIASKDVEVGQNVLPGAPVVKLVQIADVKVNISVPENEVAQMSVGREVSVRVAALGGATFTGKVVEKDVSANALSRSYDVKAQISNPTGQLLPGMLCTLCTTGATDAQAIVLPTHIVQLDAQNRNFVWVANNGKAEKRYVKVGQYEPDGIQIADGLAEGDQVITEGQQKVSNGMDITVE